MPRKAPMKTCASCGEKVHARTKKCKLCGGSATPDVNPARAAKNRHAIVPSSLVWDQETIRNTVGFVRHCGGLQKAVERLQSLHELRESIQD